VIASLKNILEKLSQEGLVGAYDKQKIPYKKGIFCLL